MNKTYIPNICRYQLHNIRQGSKTSSHVDKAHTQASNEETNQCMHTHTTYSQRPIHLIHRFPLTPLFFSSLLNHQPTTICVHIHRPDQDLEPDRPYPSNAQRSGVYPTDSNQTPCRHAGHRRDKGGSENMYVDKNRNVACFPSPLMGRSVPPHPIPISTSAVVAPPSPPAPAQGLDADTQTHRAQSLNHAYTHSLTSCTYTQKCSHTRTRHTPSVRSQQNNPLTTPHSPHNDPNAVSLASIHPSIHQFHPGTVRETHKERQVFLLGEPVVCGNQRNRPVAYSPDVARMNRHPAPSFNCVMFELISSHG
ncbi:hypothetical protein F4677DRAFT_292165 [Hypoxylon crocopeplum]|nr:hypothetical protein F4677DRAFT_292165 [Hypoxylon crocopeplum]